MSFTSIHRIMKGFNSFGQNSNGMARKRHNIGDPSAAIDLYFPNGDIFEEKCYMKEPIAQQLTRILNELRRQGSTFMKKKYHYHALHPVDLLILDEDHKFIPNDRPPGNWPSIVKSIMQERKPLLYVWSFKFCEKDKVSFPDVAHMAEPKFFVEKRPEPVNKPEREPLHLKIVPRANSLSEITSRKMPLQFDDSQSTPKAKPRLRNDSNLINSTSQPLNNAPPIPPKNKCSSMTCIDEQISSSRHDDDSFSLPPAVDGDSLASEMQHINLKRSTMVSRVRPMLCPPVKTPLHPAEVRPGTPMPIHPIAPLRNSSTRKGGTVNSVLFPPRYDEVFSDISKNGSSIHRDTSFYHQDPVAPIIPPVTFNQPVASYPMQDRIPTPIQSYKFKREQSLPSFTLPRSRNNTLLTISHNRNNIDSSSAGHYEPIVPAIPPKSKRAIAMAHGPVAPQAPVAKPRRIKTEVSRHNLSQQVSSPHFTPKLPPKHTPSGVFQNNNNNSTAYPTSNQLLHYPIPLPKKPSSFISPMPPPRMKSSAPYPVRN